MTGNLEGQDAGENREREGRMAGETIRERICLFGRMVFSQMTDESLSRFRMAGEREGFREGIWQERDREREGIWRERE